MLRHIHYEAAFEDYLRSRSAPFVPVQEQRRAVLAGTPVKSFDFLVYSPEGAGWLVDIKGRKFPYDLDGGDRYWENWVGRDDLDGMRSWESVFGSEFTGVFVFAYWVTAGWDRLPPGSLHLFRDHVYSFLGVPAGLYARHAACRSPSWETVSMPVPTFRKLVRPFFELAAAADTTAGSRAATPF